MAPEGTLARLASTSANGIQLLKRKVDNLSNRHNDPGEANYRKASHDALSNHLWSSCPRCARRRNLKRFRPPRLSNSTCDPKRHPEKKCKKREILSHELTV